MNIFENLKPADVLNIVEYIKTAPEPKKPSAVADPNAGGADKEGNPVNNLNQSLASFNFDRGSRLSAFNSLQGVHGITRDS